MFGDYFLHHKPLKGSAPDNVDIDGRNFIHAVGQEFFKAFADWTKGFVNDSCDRVANKIQDDFVTPMRVKLTGGIFEKDDPKKPC